MPICQTCHKEWTWMQTIKNLFKLKCPFCGSKQYEAAASKKRGSLFLIIPLIIVPLMNVLLDLTVPFALFLSFLIVLLIFVTYPFILKLSNDEEPLF